MQTPLLWSAFGLLTFFPYVHLQNLTLRPYNLLYESRKLAFQDGFWSRFFKFAIINLKLLLFRYEQRTSWNAAYYFENTMDLIHWVRLQQFQWNRYYSYACQKWVKVLSVPKKESRVTLGLSWREKNLLRADVDIQGIPEKIDVAKQVAKIWTLFRSRPT